ncbi:hypothetical protein DAD186_08960 [Dermabacter vaginalis]|uniref:Uncharacterized protein n=1 Tax=Dermabacter vaginalis TaxID=1630135 RepID=A0A1B0ZHM3_9MICO|nr:hypothetical protein DAD186_08960 [Dermabacter vaginalis]
MIPVVRGRAPYGDLLWIKPATTPIFTQFEQGAHHGSA